MMGDLTSKPVLPISELESGHNERKLHTLRDREIQIIDAHKMSDVRLIRRIKKQPNTTGGNTDYYENKSSLNTSVIENNEYFDIPVKTEAYVDRRKKTPLVELFLRATLCLSTKKGDKERVKTILKAGAKVDAQSWRKEATLRLSAENGHKEIVESLLTAGANVDCEDYSKRTPLHLSAKRGHKEIVEILLKAGAKVDAEDSDKQTPLHFSILGDHVEVAEVLLRFGASVNKRDIYGRSVLECMTRTQKVKLGLKSVGKIAKIRNWIFSKPTIVKSVQSSVSTITEVKHTETIIATFTPESRITTSDDSSDNNAGQGHEIDNPAVVTHDPRPCESARTSTDSIFLLDSSTLQKSHDLCSPDVEDLGNIRQQVEEHWAKFSPVHDEGSETSCSFNVRAEVHAGRIVIPTTINIKKKTGNNYGPGTQIHLAHADLVPMYGKVIVHRTAMSHTEDDNDGHDDDDDDGDGSYFAA